MITIYAPDCNHICQKTYDGIILGLPFNTLECPCGVSGSLAVHAYYYRFIVNDEKERLRICRLRCAGCGHTHALLLSGMVPYSQIPLDAMTDTITCLGEKGSPARLFLTRPALSESNIRYVFSMYRKHWLMRLVTHGITLTDSMALVTGCFGSFKRQFMQIKKNANILYFDTT
jgi:hypothetical protein